MQTDSIPSRRHWAWACYGCVEDDSNEWIVNENMSQKQIQRRRSKSIFVNVREIFISHHSGGKAFFSHCKKERKGRKIERKENKRNYAWAEIDQNEVETIRIQYATAKRRYNTNHDYRTFLTTEERRDDFVTEYRKSWRCHTFFEVWNLSKKCRTECDR